MEHAIEVEEGIIERTMANLNMTREQVAQCAVLNAIEQQCSGEYLMKTLEGAGYSRVEIMTAAMIVDTVMRAATAVHGKTNHALISAAQTLGIPVQKA